MSIYNKWLDAKYADSFRAIRRPVSYSIETLQTFSERVGMAYHVAPIDQERTSEIRPIEGLINICELENGVSLSASDVASKHNAKQSGELPRSVAIILHLGGVDINVSFSNGLRLALAAGEAKMVCLDASTVMSHVTENGKRSRTVLLHCRPEQMEAQELVPHIKKLTERNKIIDVNLLSGTWQKARQIFSDATCDLSRDLLCKSLAQEMLVQVIAFARQDADTAKQFPQRDIDRLSEVKLTIDRDPQGDHSLVKLAQLAGMSSSTLKRKFSEIYGMPVGSYLRLVRMEEAKSALEMGRLSIAQAAHVAGYRHAGNFSAAFRKCYGMSPSDLRTR